MTELTRTIGVDDRDPRVDGAVDALRRTVLAVRDAWEVVLLFVLVAPLSALLGSAGGIIGAIGSAVGVYLVGADRPGSVERGSTSNSLGVRVLLTLLAAFVAGLAIVVGLLLLVLPGLYLFTRLYLVVPAVMLGDDGPLEALSSSWDRTDGNVLTVAGVALAVFAVSSAVTLGLQFALTGGISPTELTRTAGIGFAEVGGTLVGGPLGAAAMAVLYNGLE